MRVPTKVPVRTTARSTRDEFFLVHVPMDGAPEITSHPTRSRLREEVDELISRKAQGWVYVFHGRQESFELSSAARYQLGGVASEMSVLETEAVLPGTELQPIL